MRFAGFCYNASVQSSKSSLQIHLSIVLLLGGAISAGVAVYTAQRSPFLYQDLRTQLESHARLIKSTSTMELAVMEQRSIIGSFMLDPDHHWVDDLEKKRQEFDGGIAAARTLATSPADLSLLDRISQLYREHQRIADELLALQQNGLRDEARQQLHAVRGFADQVQGATAEIASLHEQAMQAAREQSETRLAAARTLVWGCSAASVLCVLIGLWLIVAAFRSRLARSEKLATLGQMAGMVAHEVRNPLIAINLRMDALEEVMTGPEGRDEIQVIRQEIDRLKRIIQTFLDFARLRDPQLKPIQAATMLLETLYLVKPMLGEHEIHLESDVTEDLPGIEGDSEQLKQVYLNLLLNAIQAMPQGGRLRVHAQAGPKGREDAAWVEIRVSDTGVGIPSMARRRIFDPFFTTKPQGTGLGLSVAKKIIELHGGTIDLELTAGPGTTFCVRLPAVTMPASIKPRRGSRPTLQPRA